MNVKVVPELDGFDPLAPDQLDSPYPWLEAARRLAPVFYMARYDLWFVTRYEDVCTIYRNPALFSNVAAHQFLVPMPPTIRQEIAELGDGPLEVEKMLNAHDPPEHTRLRKLIQPAFAQGRMRRFESDIESLAERLIDAFDDDCIDFVDKFAGPFPPAVIALVLGIPAADSERFRQWANDSFLLTGAMEIDETEAIRCWRSVLARDRYIRELIRERQLNPQDDVISAWLNDSADVDTPSLTEDEILSNAKALVNAGSDSTGVLIANLIYLLLSHPDQWARLKSDLSLIPNAIDETLRFLSPVRGLIRTTTREVELSGVTIPEGARIYLGVASSGRDESVFPHAEDWDIARANAARHLGLGNGAHFCIGGPLAKLETRVALEVLVRRYPDIKLREDSRTLNYSRNMILPTVEHLMVRLGTPRMPGPHL